VELSTVASIPLFAAVPRRHHWHLVLARRQFRELLFAAPTVAARIRGTAIQRA
jgi:hypothetical protein